MHKGTIRQKAKSSEVNALAKSVLQEAVVNLTAAQVLASNTTPVVLVPAQGAGTIVDVESVTAYVDYNSTAYATNTTLEVRYTDGNGAKVTADIAALLNATADKVNTVKGVTTELVNVANAPVILRTATGNPTAGNSPVKVVVRYKVITL